MGNDALERIEHGHPHPHPHVHPHDHEHGADEHGEGHPVDSELSRRDFLRVSTTLAASATLATAACQAPVENIVPFSDAPEGLRTSGKKVFYATVLDGAPMLAWNREGRPILVAPNKAHPSRAGLSVRTHAALLDLYDPDRAQLPYSVRRGKGEPVESSWSVVTPEVARALAANRGKIALLVRPATGAGTKAALDMFAQTVGAKVVEYAPFQADNEVAAYEKCFGAGPMATPRLDRAKMIVGFGAEFMDVPAGSLERDFAARRDPDAGMSKFVAFEGRLSLTGANADKRVRVRESQLAAVAFGLASELVAKRGVGPLANDQRVKDALAAFSLDAVSRATGVPAEVLTKVADDLAAAGAESLAIAGGTALASANGLLLGTAVNLLNAALGAFGTTLDTAAAFTPPHGGLAALEALVADMKSGAVTVLLVAGPNPAYDTPKSLGFAEAASKLALFVSLNDRIDETSKLADYLAPASHAFESWGDAVFPGNVHTVQQPLIRPLYATHGLVDVLLAWAKETVAPSKDGAVATKTATTAEAAGPLPMIPQGSKELAYHFLRSEWAKLFGVPVGGKAFEDAWDKVLRDGYWQGPATPAAAPAFDAAALGDLAAALAAPAALEVTFHPHFAHLDGRTANNGWLHEMPDPLTRVTWGNWVGIAPKVFDKQGLKNGDLMTIDVGGQKLELPAYRHAGLHEAVISIPLGLGRTAGGKVASGIGVNAFSALASANGRLIRSGVSAQMARGKGNDALAITQGSEVLDRKARPLFPVASLEEYKKNPKAGTEQEPGDKSAYAPKEYKKQRWAMSIDLSKCDGCAKCTIACQSENNIPVVGKLGVIQGREMSWIRIDRYWDAGSEKQRGDDVWDGPIDVVEEPKALFEPMLCQHCDNAPCESVCPFSATMHSEDGMNEQVYNRCVGTRYCSNNCPFKVRRFNWHEYSAEKKGLFLRMLIPQLEQHATLNVRGRLPLKNNPEVTVRSRGVMEKCSFCVQRVREARAEAIRQGHPGKIADGEVMPACMEACPTEAIVFGDVNDPNSRVRKLVESPRAMRLLEATNVAPAVRYLTKVRHDG